MILYTLLAATSTNLTAVVDMLEHRSDSQRVILPVTNSMSLVRVEFQFLRTEGGKN